jgi:hypothetical protein
MNHVTTTNPGPPKKPKADQTEFADARRACRTTTEHEQLALILRARWTSAELQEFARLFYFKNGRDYPTPSSYRRAIADLARHYHGMTYTDTKPSQYPHEWLRQFRKGGSKLMPPRREGLLIRGRGNGPEVTSEEYAWPHHTEAFRSMIEQRCRDYFDIAPNQPVHPNAWAASHRAYLREQSDLRRAEEDAKHSLLGKPTPLAVDRAPSRTGFRRAAEHARGRRMIALPSEGSGHVRRSADSSNTWLKSRLCLLRSGNT